MKAIKIDVTTKSVYQVELLTKNGSQLASIYAHLGCELITSIPMDLPGNDTLFVDDEGLLKTDEQLPGAFLFKGYPQVLAGNGLIVGTDDEGDTIAPFMTVDQVSALVTWRGIGDLVPAQIKFIPIP